MKILAVVCSHAGEKSNTARLCNMLYEAYDKNIFKGQAQYECITLDKYNINFCKSCSSCFNKGICPVEEIDDIGILKKKILQCDILMMGSPVYVASVSGSYKNLVDRLSLWAHTLSLAGKICIPVSTASGNNLNAAVDIISRDMTIFGTVVLPGVSAYVDMFSPRISKIEDMEPLLNKVCSELETALADRKNYVSELLRNYFKVRKKLFARLLILNEKYGIALSGEAKIWHESGFDKFESYDDLIDSILDENNLD